MFAGANMLKTSKTVVKIWVLIRRPLVRVQVGEPEQEKGRMQMRPFLHFRRQSVLQRPFFLFAVYVRV